MDLNLTPEEARFRDEVREWLEANLPRGWEPLFENRGEDMESWVQFLKEWQRKLFGNGLVGIGWPREYGGRGATMIEQLILTQELARAGAPELLHIAAGLELVGPALMHYGTPEQKQRYLPRILSAKEVWSQGFSEPGAGSDLAALQTRAVLEDGHFVVTGQKVWISSAGISDYNIMLVRTDPDAPRHKGISCLLVDMHSPGVTLTPTRQMTGESEFAEIFLDGVKVPRENLLGGLNEGWSVAMTILMYERGTAAIAAQQVARTQLDELLELAKSLQVGDRPAAADPILRQRLAQAHIEVEILKHIIYRSVSEIQRTGKPGSESSIIKTFWSEMERRQKEVAMEMQGLYSQLSKGSKWAVDDGRWQREYLWSRAGTIYSGSSEIQRNIIALRVLGMPRG